MKAAWSYLRSTIGSKHLVGVTGLGLSLFVLVHMAGNMLIFLGPKAYNMYSHALISNPFIYVAEAGLVALFLLHLGKATQLQLKNWGARSRYAVAASGPKKTTSTQKTLWAQGSILLVFVILHLNTFKYGPTYTVTYGGQEVRDLFQLVVEVFQSPAYVVGYVFALLVLGFHLSHGVGSTFQTLGLHHPRYQHSIKMVSWVYAIVVAAGFISQPIYVYLVHEA